MRLVGLGWSGSQGPRGWWVEQRCRTLSISDGAFWWFENNERGRLGVEEAWWGGCGVAAITLMEAEKLKTKQSYHLNDLNPVHLYPLRKGLGRYGAHVAFVLLLEIIKIEPNQGFQLCCARTQLWSPKHVLKGWVSLLGTEPSLNVMHLECARSWRDGTVKYPLSKHAVLIQAASSHIQATLLVSLVEERRAGP